MHAAVALLLVVSVGLEQDARFSEAQQLYRDVEFERATIKFQEAALDARHPPEDRALILVWVGMCRAQLGELPSARTALEQAVALHAAVAAPSAAPPIVRELLEDVRAAATPKPEPEPEPEPEPSAAPGAEVSSTATPPAEDGAGANAPLITLGWVSAGAGGLALVGASVVGSLGVANVIIAFDEETTQRDAASAGELANAGFWAAGVLAGVAVVLISTGVALVALAPGE
jgi:hypothetical protein